MDDIIKLVNDKRDVYNVKHPAAAPLGAAEFKDDARKNLIFSSLNSLAKHLKGDRQVIREYLTGKNQVIIEVNENLLTKVKDI